MSWRTWVFLGLFRWKQELRRKLSKPPNHMARLVQISLAFKQPLPRKCCWEFGKPMTLDSCTKLGIKGKTTRPKQEAWNKEVTLKTKQSTSIWTVFRWMSTFKSPNCFCVGTLSRPVSDRPVLQVASLFLHVKKLASFMHSMVMYRQLSTTMKQ